MQKYPSVKDNVPSKVLRLALVLALLWVEVGLFPSNRTRSEMGQLSGPFNLLNDTETWRKRNKSTGKTFKKSSGEGAPRLQISVLCRGQTRPEL